MTSMTIEWKNANPKAVEAARIGKLGQAHEPFVVLEDFTFAWDTNRKAYYPTKDCLPGARPEAL